MAGIVISALPPIVTPQLSDLFVTVQGGVTYKVTGTQLGSSLFLPISGGTMTGFLILNADPVAALGAATKQYVDSVASGLDVQPACRLGTTANLNAIYSNGVGGVGATLTNNGALASLTIDGVLTTVGIRILVKDQTSTPENGIYTVTVVGDGATPWVLTRATDFDTAAEITPGAYVFVLSGTVNTSTSYVQTATVTTVGTDPIVWNQFGSDVNTLITAIQNQAFIYANDTGAANAYVIAPSPAITAYVAGQRFDVKIGTNNSGASTLAVSGLAAKNIKLTDGTDPLASNIRAGGISSFEYDGTNFELLNPNYGLGGSTGTGLVVRTLVPTLSQPVINGVTNASSAAVGQLGETISASVAFASAITITTTLTPQNITSIAVSAGNWIIYGNAYFIQNAATVQGYNVWVSTTSATIPDVSLITGVAISANLLNQGMAAPTYILKTNTPTTVYLTGYAQFSAGNPTMCGQITAVRFM